MDNNYDNGQYQNDDGFNKSYYDTLKERMVDNTNQSAQKVRSALARTYVAMIIVLVISGISAYATYASGLWYNIFASNLFYILCFAEIGIVLISNLTLRKQLVVPSALLLILYSVVNGLTLSSIFALYDITSIGTIFFITAAMFAALAIIGTCTSRDLTSLGTMGYAFLIGIIIASLVNYFLIHSATGNLIITAAGLAIFIGITAYDSQKIKRLAQSGENVNTIALFGALTLYLDFVNILLRLLSLFGKRR